MIDQRWQNWGHRLVASYEVSPGSVSSNVAAIEATKESLKELRKAHEEQKSIADRIAGFISELETKAKLKMDAEKAVSGRQCEKEQLHRQRLEDVNADTKGVEDGIKALEDDIKGMRRRLSQMKDEVLSLADGDILELRRTRKIKELLYIMTRVTWVSLPQEEGRISGYVCDQKNNDVHVFDENTLGGLEDESSVQDYLMDCVSAGTADEWRALEKTWLRRIE